MSINPYLNFNGKSMEAIYFYKNAFEAGEPEIMFYRDMPPDDDFPITDENEDLVMHAELEINGTMFMFTDTTGEDSVNFDGNITILFDTKDRDELEKVYERLLAGGKVLTKLQETFWSKAYGSIVDKFGVGWQFNLNE